ncbi:hypothetical protein M5689_023577 [Euphorbia peplus]|nr:hypothetical protein M5689_023577 [Euphorbia peplus]
MVVLRSRQIDPSPKPQPQPQPEPEPQTPARINEPSASPSLITLNLLDRLGSDSLPNRRRSLRLASKSPTPLHHDCLLIASTNTNRADTGKGKLIDTALLNANSSLATKNIVTIDLESTDHDNDDDDDDDELVIVEERMKCDANSKRKRPDSADSVLVNANSSSGKKILKIDLECTQDDDDDDNKAVFVKEEQVECDGERVESLTFNGVNIVGSSGSGGRYSRDDKGKEKLVYHDDVDDSKPNLDIGGVTKLELEAQLEGLKLKFQDLVDTYKDTIESANQPNISSSSSTRMDRFREIARKNASRFAHFESQDQNLAPDVDEEMPFEEEIDNVEDWPGPFSTAMKIIRDREKKLNSQLGQFASKEAKSVPINWIPSRPQGSNLSRPSVPSLLDLCMKIIVKNVDAVTSLDHVPDALRHKLCRLLSDSRGMNSCFLELIVRGSPTEIRIKDCSWLTEEEFTKCFGACDTSNLSVLQLDQCGRCIADYLLPATLARSSRSMPALITLSLSGACRLTDIGLSSLLSAAPALRSINLSQCSLLTSVGIGTLAESLGSHLLELYIDDCQSLDLKLILPALKKLEHLEVLSLAGIQAIYDGFVREFVSVRGHNMKELVLADCMNLTDSSIKVIAETCPGLLALDLVNLVKLTDATLGYLANSCQRIQSLKLCRNNFSDEAIASFLETSGEPLKELSLNNVAQVGHNTALALAKRSRSLEILDLSWCRNLTDEAVGLIVDSCSSLKVLKLFGCGQITNMFLNGHSNEGIEIIGVKLSPALEHVRVRDTEEFPLRYTSASSFCNVN